ncbi:hypothetical protein FOZ61_005686 [Perkinsus olseni]|uniref:Uncharacterized protein n=1 Tax=Perkinsus olseni TaxID=32597 RepID=A0A7J6LGF5_PEROL|nr:hypothetical protein FOZ61_005686 [Perkinsus olseni]
MSNATAAEQIRAGLDAVSGYVQPVIDKARPAVTEAYGTLRTALSGLSAKAQVTYEEAFPAVQKWYHETAQPAVRQLTEQAKPYTEPLGDLYDQTISTAGLYSRQLLGDHYGSYVERALPNVFIALAISGFLWVGIFMKQTLGSSGAGKIVEQSKDAQRRSKSKTSGGKKREESTTPSSPPESDHERTKKQRTPKKGGHKQPKKAPVFPKPESLSPKPKRKPAASKASQGKKAEAPASHGNEATNTDADGWSTVTGKRRYYWSTIGLRSQVKARELDWSGVEGCHALTLR